LITDSSGNAIGTYQYDAYGNATSETGSATTPLQYAGQYKRRKRLVLDAGKNV
jgi:hypothetical protein